MGAQGSRNIESGNEWATPWPVVRHAARCLGIEGFDLDPAATPGNAKAPAFFDRDADGTSQPWFGYVWLNPPLRRGCSGAGKPGSNGRGKVWQDNRHWLFKRP